MSKRYENSSGRVADQQRVVVVSVGAITSLGRSAEELWQQVKACQVGIRTLQEVDIPGFADSLGGEICDAPRPKYDYLTPLGLSHPEPYLDFALLAAEEAMASSAVRLLEEGEQPRAGYVSRERWGVAFGTCNGGVRSAELAARRELVARENNTTVTRGGVDPHLVLVSPNAATEALAAAFTLKGAALTVNTACSASSIALAHAVEQIRAGRVDAMLVGGSDALAEMSYCGFNSLESLSHHPAAPYSRTRDGLSLGEGAGMMVVVGEDIARAAQAPILAEILGCGLSADGYHPTAPHPEGEGAARAIRAAMQSGGLGMDHVSYINGHGTGTPKNDVAESNAVRAAFGDAAIPIVLSSTKSQIGHLLGAAGTVEAIVTMLALRDQTTPPTANFTDPDPACGLDASPNTTKSLQMDVALSNNFAFAGANVCVAYSRPDRPQTPKPPADDDDVVVTGIGVLTADADDAAGLWEAYQRHKAKSGAREARGPSYARVENLHDRLPPKERRRVDRIGQLAVVACTQAAHSAGLECNERVGVMLGTSLGPVSSIIDFYAPVLNEGPSLSNPAIFPNTVFNAAAGRVSMALGAKGPTSTLPTGHVSGATALGAAFDVLRTNQAEAVLCGSVDELSVYVENAYNSMPFFTGGHGSGYRMVEGAVVLTLERAGVARRRGAKALATISGYHTANDALGIAQWDRQGRGVERAMRGSCANAGLDVEELRSIWANEAGVAALDRPERQAIRRLQITCPTFTPKRVLGEPIGAGTQLSIALAIASWHNDVHPGPALINSSSLGGIHTSVVLQPVKDDHQ